MSTKKSSSSVGKSKEKLAVDLISNFFNCDAVLPENVTEWPGVNALAIRDKIILAHDPSAGLMPLGFAYFIQKDLHRLKMQFRVDRAARYMSEPVINAMHQTRRNILHSFLVL